jgi:hypothetical protein
MANYYDEVMNRLTQKQIDAMPDYSRVQTAEGDPRIVGGFDEYGGKGAWSPIAAAEWGSGMPFGDDPSAQIPTGLDASGVPQFTDPVGYRGYGLDRASVVPPPNYQGSYNPAGGWAEAGRLAPDNIAAANVAAMNQVTQPFGGMGAGDRLGGAGYPGMGIENMGFPHGITAQGAVDPATGQMRVVPPGTSGGYGYEDEQGNWIDVTGASVVDPPRMPTERETLDREVMGPANERDAAFSTIHDAYYTGADFGYEQGWPERLGVPQEYINLYMAVPDEAKQYAHDNPTDAILQQFEEKYGFPLDVSIEISM